MKKILLIILIMSDLAISRTEKEMSLVSIKELAKDIGLESKSFVGEKKETIHFLELKKEGASCGIVIVPGRGEAAVKYAETVEDLGKTNCSVFVIENRGQGKNSRHLKNTQKGHIDSFDTYVYDLKKMMENLLKDHKYEDWYLMGHSMGGAISSLFLYHYPDVFKKAILLAPMHGINTGSFDKNVALYFSEFLIFFGLDGMYAPGQGDWDVDQAISNLKKGMIPSVTSSQVRRKALLDLMKEEPYFIIGGATVSWINTAMKSTNFIKDAANRIKTPVMIMQAVDERLVINAAQDYFCSKAKNCLIKEFPGARHELLNEKDHYRDIVIREIIKFFSK